ncbi:MAG: beta-glucosidase [Pseudonocardia sp.]|nr:beta-glucosidase [Pseudonocardia sp.]
MRRSRVLLAAPVALVVTLLLTTVAGCSGTTGSATSAENPSAGPPASSAVDSGCVAAVAALAPRARLAQLLMVGVDPTDPAAAVERVRTWQVGGIFIGGDSTKLLVNGALGPVQAVAKVPVAVAVDEEGGRVQRVDALDGSIPSARQMSVNMTPAEVRTLALSRGRALKARGVTVDLAPVVDVGNQPADDVIGDRSFGADPATVSRFAGAFAAGLRDAGVLPVLKHFPGHGQATGDSHQGKVTTPALAALKADDLRPYEDLIGAGPVGVMVGHLDVPGLTGGEPATISPAAYELLRGQYRHSGLVLTDDLGAMKAISDRYDLPDAVVKALAAGADVALWSSGDRIGEVLNAMEAAVSSGKLPAERVDASVRRILAAKGACGPPS